MILSHYLLNTPIEFEENRVNVLTVEEPKALRSFLLELTDQRDGEEGGFVLSAGNDVMDFAKNAEVVTDILDFSLNSKKLQSRLEKQAATYAAGHEKELMAAVDAVNLLAELTTADFSENIGCSYVETAEDLVKVMGFYADETDLDLPQKVLEYMRLYRSYFGIRLFVFCNLKLYLSSEELSLMYRAIAYEKFDVLLIEGSYKDPAASCEINRIIDHDLCEF